MKGKNKIAASEHDAAIVRAGGVTSTIGFFGFKWLGRIIHAVVGKGYKL